MKLHELKASAGARKAVTRKGRGAGSGNGKTAGFGHKGQKARSGVKKAGFEGGQMPLQRRLPKRGFNNIFATKYVTIKVSDLEKFEAGATVDAQALLDAGIISKTLDGRKVLDNVSFRVNKGDKIAFVGEDEIAKTTLFKIVMGEMEPDEGTYKWGTTITTSYFPLDNSAFFNDCDLNLVDWLAQFTPKIPEANTESFKRAFLGRMLFSGDDVFKPVKVLSGGEKVRCMLSRMMLYGSNVLVLDQPTNHLDLESITAVNNGLMDFKGVVLFSSHDHEFVQTIANRIMVLEDGKLTDRLGTYEDYIASMANTAE